VRVLIPLKSGLHANVRDWACSDGVMRLNPFEIRASFKRRTPRPH